MGRTRRYCVMQIPSQMAITRVGAPIWLAILVFCWCVRLRRPRATCCLPLSCSTPQVVPCSLLNLPSHRCPMRTPVPVLFMHAQGALSRHVTESVGGAAGAQWPQPARA